MRPKSELSDWMRHNKPTVLKRSEDVGYIAVLSSNCTRDMADKFLCGSEDMVSKYADLNKVIQFSKDLLVWYSGFFWSTSPEFYNHQIPII